MPTGVTFEPWIDEILRSLGATVNWRFRGLGLRELRGRWHSYKATPLMITYHPAYLLRNPAAKKDVWEDMKLLLKQMGLEVPTGKREE